MSQSNVITLRVPLDLKQRLVRVAQAQGVSLNQLAYALTKEITLMESSAVRFIYLSLAVFPVHSPQTQPLLP